jgi:hypothetical protein
MLLGLEGYNSQPERKDGKLQESPYHQWVLLLVHIIIID